MTKFTEGYNSLDGILLQRSISQRVRYMSGLLQRHNIETALKLAEIELQISREDACLLLCEVAGELSAVVRNNNKEVKQ